ncbi:glycerate kinase type-2 family protein [Yunchengibacter salinarum]|uniref:glycerate kinase type-2 family protein n=1 Tax=Yunchengibacter salinarum TaxID=3133399 RepID=UPI0035B63D5C
MSSSLMSRWQNDLPVGAPGPAPAFLLQLFAAAVDRVSAARCLPPHLPIGEPEGETLVLGAGKAAAAMAAIAETHLPGAVRGMVITRYGHVGDGLPDRIIVREAAHPVPDDMSGEAAREALNMAAALKPTDRLVFLASGGGSALMSLPGAGLGVDEKAVLMRHLLHSGAAIEAMNCVRKHLSAIKGGRLAAASGTQDIHSFVISDIPSDDPAMVASGPTLADPTTLADARAIMEKIGSPDPALIDPALIDQVLNDPRNETPKYVPGICHLIATGEDALVAAATVAEQGGDEAVGKAKAPVIINLGAKLTGEARDLGAAHARLALDHAARRRAGDPPVLILSGGETGVTVRNADGCGGRNLEYLAGLAHGLDGAPGIIALAADTDGIDGSEDNAGAFVLPDTLGRARAAGVDTMRAQQQNRTHDIFRAAGTLLHTGPTLTNVNDFRAILVGAP